MSEPVLSEVSSVRTLAGKLGRYRQIAQHDSAEEPESRALANALSDVESSCRKIALELLPALVRGEGQESKTIDVLIEIGEELGHILYHVKDSHFYGYIHDRYSAHE
ncbi:MAG TPA: hypothetical protein VF986_02775 [Actinomycetota bacterium]